MLLTDKAKPLIAKTGIKCFKVMVFWNDNFYVCPPALQHFIKNNIKLEKYKLNTLYQTEANDSKKDYRIKWEIWTWFFHTFCDIKSAKDFIGFLNDRMANPELTKKSELYKIPKWSKIVILNARIPNWSLYYKWVYKEVFSEKVYASNKIIYENIFQE